MTEHLTLTTICIVGTVLTGLFWPRLPLVTRLGILIVAVAVYLAGDGSSARSTRLATMFVLAGQGVSFAGMYFASQREREKEAQDQQQQQQPHAP